MREVDGFKTISLVSPPLGKVTTLPEDMLSSGSSPASLCGLSLAAELQLSTGGWITHSGLGVFHTDWGVRVRGRMQSTRYWGDWSSRDGEA